MGIPVLKDIPGYEGRYSASADGRIYSHKTKRWLKPNISRNGYESVELFNKGMRKRMLIHRLIAIAFIPNPENKEQVNHRDENKRNNSIENLEWSTRKENMNYGTRTLRQINSTDYTSEKRKNIARENGKAAAKPVLQISRTGEIINRFDSIVEAQRALCVKRSHIVECCRGKRKSSNGYLWRYERSEDLSVFQY